MTRTTSDSRIRLVVNGHELVGTGRGGRWTFECGSWPELAAKHRGDATAAAAIEDFMGRCLAGAVTVEFLAREGGAA